MYCFKSIIVFGKIEERPVVKREEVVPKRVCNVNITMNRNKYTIEEIN